MFAATIVRIGQEEQVARGRQPEALGGRRQEHRIEQARWRRVVARHIVVYGRAGHDADGVIDSHHLALLGIGGQAT